MGAKQSQVETARESSCPQKRQSARETNKPSQLGNKRGIINTADLSESTPKCLRPRKLDCFSARIRKDDTATIQSLFNRWSLDAALEAGQEGIARWNWRNSVVQGGRERRDRRKWRGCPGGYGTFGKEPLARAAPVAASQDKARHPSACAPSCPLPAAARNSGEQPKSCGAAGTGYCLPHRKGKVSFTVWNAFQDRAAGQDAGWTHRANSRKGEYSSSLPCNPI